MEKTIVASVGLQKSKKVLITNSDKSKWKWCHRKLILWAKENNVSPRKRGRLIIEYARFYNLTIIGSHREWIMSIYNQEQENPLNKPRKIPNKIKKTRSFYDSDEWLILRRIPLKLYGRTCMKCGSTTKIHVDHIKPRSLHPLLELELQNLQILCKDCNNEKSNKNEADYRTSKHLNLLAFYLTCKI